MDKDKRKKSVKDYSKAYLTALKLQGGAGGRTISDQDVENILKKQKSSTTVGVSANIKRMLEKVGLTASQMKKLREQLKGTVKSNKGKPHLKHGGKAKKKYGVVGKPTLKKGGKA